MTAAYLLDTNMVSNLLRFPFGIVATRIDRIGIEAVCTSIIVAGELQYGASKSGLARIQERLAGGLERLTIANLEPPADRYYGELRSYLERRGMLIGSNDMLIAAQCLALGLILVTDNTREFSRVPGLTVENWLR